MKQNDRFNSILNDCLDRIFRGETVEQCLQNYPEQARELEPLLLTARAARAAAALQPRAEYKARARYEFQSAVQDMIEHKNKRRAVLSWQWRWQSGWAIALVVVIVVVLGGGGTAVASSTSMPDSALYSIKLVSEQAQLVITPSGVGKAELNAAFVDRRTDEIVYMASKGDAQEVQLISQRLSTNLANMNNLVTIQVGNQADTTADGMVPAAPTLDTGIAVPQSENGPEPIEGAAAAPAPATAASTTIAPQRTTAGSTPASTPATGTVLPTTALSPAVPPVPAVTTVPRIDVKAPSPTSTAKSAERIQDTPSTLKATDTRISDREKIKQIIIANFNKSKTRLEMALETASPEVKPAIRQAIAISTAEYEKVLRNIERAENAD